jgi:hypothetical protein
MGRVRFILIYIDTQDVSGVPSFTVNRRGFIIRRVASVPALLIARGGSAEAQVSNYSEVRCVTNDN